jgi:FAD:protein FMN transferase
MPSADRLIVFALCGTLGAAVLPAREPAPGERQRYVMGTMFRVVAYAESAAAAERAIDAALAEIVRVDEVMSHYKAGSDLSRLNREAASGPVAVDPSLYEVVEESLAYSRLSDGRFDVTIGRLLRTWKDAHAAGRSPSASEIEEAARCVGHQHVELVPPDRIRFGSGCLELDLGAIGKGYAVERALAVMRARGVRDAMVNAGGSTIGASGAPPGERGWPVRIGAAVSGSRTVLLRDESLSTSQQGLTPPMAGRVRFGEIIDTETRAPLLDTTAVSVVARSATDADALSTTLLLMSIEEGRALLEQFPAVSALWISPAGELRAVHGASQLELARHR